MTAGKDYAADNKWIRNCVFWKKDADEKGIYVTTKFIAAFHVPVIPLASYWVMPYGIPATGGPISIQQFEAVQIPLDWRQILSVYVKWYVGLAAALTSLFFVLTVYTEYLDLSDGKPHLRSPLSTEASRNLAAYLYGLKNK